MRYIFFLFFFFLVASVSANDDIMARVIAVHDGNTLTIETIDNETYEVLLFGIDSPELGQAYGKMAKSFLEKITLKKKVTVQFHGKDRTGRRLVVIVLPNEDDPRVELL